MTKRLNEKCITCNNMAEHQLSYSNLQNEVNWIGNYCTICFVKKLRGMVQVWNSKIKKFCSKCNVELKDKRFDRCDKCLGLVYEPKQEITH